MFSKRFCKQGMGLYVSVPGCSISQNFTQYQTLAASYRYISEMQATLFKMLPSMYLSLANSDLTPTHQQHAHHDSSRAISAQDEPKRRHTNRYYNNLLYARLVHITFETMIKYWILKNNSSLYKVSEQITLLSSSGQRRVEHKPNLFLEKSLKLCVVPLTGVHHKRQVSRL
jgi:hypothetical protein